MDIGALATNGEISQAAAAARASRPARNRHRVHVRGPLPSAAVPGPGGGRQPASRSKAPLIYLIDALSDVDVTPLAALLGDPECEVVLHAGRQDVAILRRAWGTDAQQHLRHPDRRRLQRRQRPGRLRQPARRDARTPGRQDRQLHALGRPAADRRAARLRGRGRRSPAPARRRDPAASDRQRAGSTGRARSAAGSSPRPTSAIRTPPGNGCRASGSSTRARARSRASSPPGASGPRRTPTARSARSSPTRRWSSWPSASPSTISGLEQIRGAAPADDQAPRPGDPRRDRARARGGADPARRGARPLGPGRRAADRARRGAAARSGARGRPRLRADRVARRARADRRRGPPRRARARRADADRLAARARRRRPA